MVLKDNILIQLNKVRNTYFVMRHFFSIANQNQVLAGTPGGEHDLGIVDADFESHTSYIEEFFPRALSSAGRVIVLTSTLKRAIESGRVVADILGALNYKVMIEQSPHLNERYYGELEGSKVSEWRKLYRADLLSPDSSPYLAESVTQLLNRLVIFINNCEANFEREKILLISHCDPIQAVEMLFARRCLKHYSEVKETRCGEIRKLAM
jgi:hypothetical protein